MRIVYELRVPAGVERVPLSVLEMGTGRLGHARARVGEGADAPVSWEAADGPARSALVAVPSGRGPDPVRMELSYRVRDAVESRAGDLRVRVPVALVSWPPEEALPGTFRARALLPDTLHVTGTFPTVLGEVREASGGRRAYAFDLQVVPGVVVVEMTPGGRPLLTFARGLDAAVMALLLVLGVLGFGALRREAA